MERAAAFFCNFFLLLLLLLMPKSIIYHILHCIRFVTLIFIVVFTIAKCKLYIIRSRRRLRNILYTRKYFMWWWWWPSKNRKKVWCRSENPQSSKELCQLEHKPCTNNLFILYEFLFSFIYWLFILLQVGYLHRQHGMT